MGEVCRGGEGVIIYSCRYTRNGQRKKWCKCVRDGAQSVGVQVCRRVLASLGPALTGHHPEFDL